jgi:hypothetical protein
MVYGSVIYLEKHVHDEHFITLASESVQTIGERRKDPDEDTDVHDALKECTENCICPNCHGIAKQKHSNATENSSQTHKYQTELWLAAWGQQFFHGITSLRTYYTPWFFFAIYLTTGSQATPPIMEPIIPPMNGPAPM